MDGVGYTLWEAGEAGFVCVCVRRPVCRSIGTTACRLARHDSFKPVVVSPVRVSLSPLCLLPAAPRPTSTSSPVALRRPRSRLLQLSTPGVPEPSAQCRPCCTFSRRSGLWKMVPNWGFSYGFVFGIYMSESGWRGALTSFHFNTH